MARAPSRPIETTGGQDRLLLRIVEAAYKVFDYPTPSSTGVCVRCCMDPKIEADFFTWPIRDLPLGSIRDWYGAAYDPTGIPKETWAYLLPRILEFLAAGEDVSYTGLEVSLNRYETGNPDKWSPDEWHILSQFQHAYLHDSVVRGPEPLDDVLCMFRLAGWSLEDLQDQVAAFSDAELAEKLWKDWCGWVTPGREDIWQTAFWTESDRARMTAFYTSRELYRRMEALALSDEVDPQLAEKASGVASVIEARAGGVSLST